MDGYSHPQNVTYFFHMSQNEIISILNLITETICNEVRVANHFSIECDEETSHKRAFRLSLVLEHSVKDVPTIKAIFETIGDIYRFMEGSPKRHKVYENHLMAKGITSGKIVLHFFSDTRCSALSDNLEVAMNVYLALLSIFKVLSEQHINMATGLLVRLRQSRFVAACLILNKCFSLSQYVFEYLQNEDMDLISGVAAIRDLRAMMESFRSDNEFDTFLAEATSFAERYGS
eukprot:gene1903-16403_t